MWPVRVDAKRHVGRLRDEQLSQRSSIQQAKLCQDVRTACSGSRRTRKSTTSPHAMESCSVQQCGVRHREFALRCITVPHWASDPLRRSIRAILCNETGRARPVHPLLVYEPIVRAEHESQHALSHVREV